MCAYQCEDRLRQQLFQPVASGRIYNRVGASASASRRLVLDDALDVASDLLLQLHGLCEA